MPVCAYPDTSIGVVVRLSTYLDCQARALGEDGFQALIGDPIVTGLLSAVITIFVALIGYRFILGTTPSLATGVGWAVRLGFVLALVTGWPAFQTLVYRVAVDGPAELARVLLPAANLPDEGLDVRAQQAYDTMRLGAEGQRGAQVPTEPGQPQQQSQGAVATASAPTGFGPYGQPALPQTAGVFAASTIGIGAALRVAIGLLLALAPLAILGLLFDTTLGLFSGWLRALGGAVLALIGATVVTALDLMLVEGELGNWQAIERGVTVVDPQGLTTLVLCFVPVMIAAVWVSTRMAGAIRIDQLAGPTGELPGLGASAGTNGRADLPARPSSATATTGPVLPASQGRAQSIADALAGTVHRERAAAIVDAGRVANSTSIVAGRFTAGAADQASTGVTGTGTIGRRTTGRRTGSATRRDRA